MLLESLAEIFPGPKDSVVAPEEVVKGPCELGRHCLSVSQLRNGVGHRPIAVGATKEISLGLVEVRFEVNLEEEGEAGDELRRWPHSLCPEQEPGYTGGNLQPEKANKRGRRRVFDFLLLGWIRRGW